MLNLTEVLPAINYPTKAFKNLGLV